eukprot:305579_1
MATRIIDSEETDELIFNIQKDSEPIESTHSKKGWKICLLTSCILIVVITIITLFVLHNIDSNNVNNEKEYVTANPTIVSTNITSYETTLKTSTSPSLIPTASPTFEPSIEPTTEPTKEPTQEPTTEPTKDPTTEPTQPTKDPTKQPTLSPVFVIENWNNETTITVPDVIHLTFPANFFSGFTSIDIYKSYKEEYVALFNETTVLHRAIEINNITDNQIYISILNGLNDRNASSSFNATIKVTEQVQSTCPNDYGLEIFALVEQGSADEDLFEIYVLFGSKYDPIANTLQVQLTADVFVDNQASIIVACSPGGLNVHARRRLIPDKKCKGKSLLCPVDSGCDSVSSEFGKWRTINGKLRKHRGVDYAIPVAGAVGTKIFAAADGVVDRSYLSKKGYGEVIVLRHTDESATLYAHLSVRYKNATKNPLTKVKAGDIIGLSGNTGRSTGPHLHLEYVPNGIIFANKNRQDASLCIGAVSGSITVGDSGSAADDAFSITIDGVYIDTTDIGKWNSIAVSGLLPGKHILRLTIVVAPDNIGTYTITLQDGWMFEDGTTSKSGRPIQGAVVTWTLIVP